MRRSRCASFQTCLSCIDHFAQTFISLLPPHVAVPPPSAYLYLAQLSDDEPRLALQHYQSAVDLLSSQLKGKDRALDGDVDDESDLQSNIVRALIGQVEIWMDPSYDLWCVVACLSLTPT